MPKAPHGGPRPSGGRPVYLTDAIRRLSIRGALFAGFGMIFVLWSAAGVEVVGRLVEADQRTAEINSLLARAEDHISTIRTQVLLGSIYLRDALLDTPENAPFYRKQLQDSRAAVNRILEEYEPVADSLGEREAVANLRSELQEFWSSRLAVVDWDVTRRSSEARAFLRAGGIPKREEVIRISNGIQQLHRASFERRRLESAEVYRAMRRRVWITSALTLFLSAGVALMVTLYAGRLERRIRQQQVRDQQNSRDLQRLSAKLVRAQEDERRTIARELHDEVGQALTAIKLELACAECAPGLRPDTVAALNEVRSISDRALHSVRDLSHLLHPALLDDIGLPAALELHLRGFAAHTGIPTELLQDRMDERLAPEVEVCLYRIAQEALTNAARHASASSCRVYLQRLSSTVVMTVEDDGKGFSPLAPDESRPHKGLGLLGIQERVSDVRGTFRLESAPGHGTRLTVEVPAVLRKDTPLAEADGPPISLPVQESS